MKEVYLFGLCNMRTVIYCYLFSSDNVYFAELRMISNLFAFSFRTEKERPKIIGIPNKYVKEVGMCH